MFSLSSLIVILVPIFLILIIAGIVVSIRSQGRNGDPASETKGGKDMIKTVYTYLICFATLMMTIGGSVAAFMALADLVSPQAYYMSFEDYKQNQKYRNQPTSPEINQPVEMKSDEELKADFDALVQDEKNRSKERALNSLIKSFGWIVIPLPVFLYYQRRLRYE